MIDSTDLKQGKTVFFCNLSYAHIEECKLIKTLTSDADDWTCEVVKTVDFRYQNMVVSGSGLLSRRTLHFSDMTRGLWHRTYEDALNALEADYRTILERIVERRAL